MKVDLHHPNVQLRLQHARCYLRKLPPSISGQRGHDAAFRAACILIRRFSLPVDVAFNLLVKEFNPRCKPPWSQAELLHKVKDAASGSGASIDSPDLDDMTNISKAGPRTPKWPARDDSLRQQIIADGFSVVRLKTYSKVDFGEDSHRFIAPLVESLFWSPSMRDPLVCIAKDKQNWSTRPLSTWLRDPSLPSCSLIVPSTMRAVAGRTMTGKLSQRCLENTGPRRYLIIEFDSGSLDDQAALLWHLSRFCPLTMVVHSGGKSLHGWFYCQDEAEQNLRQFMNYAVRLGADSALWTPCQLVRLPLGLRDEHIRQRVLYLDPACYLQEALNACQRS